MSSIYSILEHWFHPRVVFIEQGRSEQGNVQGCSRSWCKFVWSRYGPDGMTVPQPIHRNLGRTDMIYPKSSHINSETTNMKAAWTKSCGYGKKSNRIADLNSKIWNAWAVTMGQLEKRMDINFR